MNNMSPEKMKTEHHMIPNGCVLYSKICLTFQQYILKIAKKMCVTCRKIELGITNNVNNIMDTT